MSSFCKFKIGQVVTNNEIVSEFQCGNMGGMRKSNAKNSLILISDHTKSLYDDKWYGDILHYTGMGKSGDQSLEFMQNKTLAQSQTNGVEVQLFEVLIPRQYIYQGKVTLVGEPYQEVQNGDDGIPRYVWMFPLILNDVSEPIPKGVLEENIIIKEKIAQRQSFMDLKRLAEQNGSEVVSSRKITSNAYIRDAYVAEFAKRRADGYCQLCEKPAPFSNRDGIPYLECHHIEWISKGGSDTIENTVALCPNCHRKMHEWNLKSDRDKLIEMSSKER
jgi:5-methylcytosine-specific restriction protein A